LPGRWLTFTFCGMELAIGRAMASLPGSATNMAAMAIRLITNNKRDILSSCSNELICVGLGTSRRFRTCGRFRNTSYGVNLLMYVDQLPSAARGPAAPGVGAQVPSLLSPLVAPKNRPPQVV